jgi:hypothetical protein
VNDRGVSEEHRRRWLLAVALLAGGTGICLGSVLATVFAGTAISPLVWVSVLGRLVATAGAILAWSNRETLPMVLGRLESRVRPLVSGWDGVHRLNRVRSIGTRYAHRPRSEIARIERALSGQPALQDSRRIVGTIGRGRSQGPKTGTAVSVRRARRRSSAVGQGRTRTPRTGAHRQERYRDRGRSVLKRVRTLLARAPKVRV